MSLINWIKQKSEYPRFYWSSRDSELELAGVGVREESMRALPDSFGVFKFNDQVPSDALWQDFGESRFIVPNELKTGKKIPPSPPLLKGGITPPLEKGGSGGIWHQAVRQALSEITKGPLQKIVLARRITYKAPATIDPIELLSRLQSQVPNAYHFLFEPRPGLALIGASPERLYKRSGNRIQSEAQAGTIPKGAHPDELLKNTKQLHEHQLVIDHILQAFSNLCVDYGITEARKIVPFKNVQHLKTNLAGILKEKISDTDVLQILHPTAAVCGWPRQEAFELIRKLENFDRGFYTGAIGYIGEHESEFAVAIRCAVVEKSLLHIFGGAGLVEGSIAQNEWDEIENKISFWSKL